MKQLLILVLLIYHVAAAQETSQDIRLPEPKRFIDKVEVFAGPGLSFNYGNKFVENHKDENVQNKRLLKVCYTFGVGVYHPVSDRIDINARLQYEIKGRKTELNTPLTQDSRQIDLDDYTYKYLTVFLAPQISFGKKRKSFISLGAYYNRIKGINGYGRSYNTLDYQTSEGHFKGRYFYHLRNDGGMDAFTWIPGLQSFETFDLGAIVSFGYSITIKEKQSLAIQLADNLGLKNINKDKPFGLEEKNHSIYLIVAYTLQRPPKK